MTVGIFLFCAQFLKRVPSHFLPGQGILFRVLIKQVLDRNSTIYLLESLGKVYLVCSSTQGMQVLQTFEQEEAEKLLSDQNFQVNDLLQPKDSKI